MPIGCPPRRTVTSVLDPRVLRDADDVAAHLAATCFAPTDDLPVRGAVGLEAEMFVLHTRDRRRSDLEELVAAVGAADGVVAQGGSERPRWLSADGQVTEEPGGQLELITDPEPTLASALDRLDGLATAIEPCLDAAGLALAGAGLDPFHPPEGLVVQLDLPRYRAMGTYFGRRGTNGQALMCASASLQINLDLGPPAMAVDRWLVANLAASLVVATFANSPTSEAVNGRALAWARLDPTRTGVPALIATGVDDPVAHLLWDVMRADVMLVSRGTEMSPGRPGWTFGDWVRDGHPEHGRPTTADVDMHLSTLFPEVRLRGFLEVRGVDQLPRRWRAAPAVLLTGLLYDPETTTAARTLLEDVRRDLPRLQDRAVRRGLTDPLVWDLAGPLWELAMDGARRLGEDWVGARWTATADAFLDRFTRRRRHPADEQRDLRRRSPAEALEWSR